MVLINAMTVDVEDYFQVSAFESHISKQQWSQLPHRVDRNTQQILELFARHQVKATFFTLGWVAEHYPNLVKRIVDEGHELASHGYQHIRVSEQTPGQFRQDIARTKKLLEDIGGQEVKGYRAASYSIGANNLWALEILHEQGYQYSSSIYPVRHDLYGMPEAPRFIYEPLNNVGFKEIPITTLRLMNKNFPCGGGGFFRLYPYYISKWAYQFVNSKEQQPGVFYFHPWEIDPDQPKQRGLQTKTRFRHYLNLDKMQARIQYLLKDFSWDTMEAVFLQ